MPPKRNRSTTLSETTKNEIEKKPTEEKPVEIEIKKSKKEKEENKKNELTEDTLVEKVGKANFLKGLEYFDQNAVSSFDEKNNTISSSCRGSGSNRYDVAVELNDVELFNGKCSCPVGQDGICKHVVTLILKWLEKKGKFVKKASKSHTPDEEKKLKAMRMQMSAYSIAELKKLLKENDLSSSGTKQELIERCSDGASFGALPRCPKCSGGRLRVIAGHYVCPGFMEDDEFINCDYVTSTIKRVQWKIPDKL